MNRKQKRSGVGVAVHLFVLPSLKTIHNGLSKKVETLDDETKKGYQLALNDLQDVINDLKKSSKKYTNENEKEEN